MTLSKIDFKSKETILKSFDMIANEISNHFQLKVNDAYYRIVDFEFYSFAVHFEDPHTYRHKLQREHNRMYVHASGFDITLGDGKENYCGVLIRSIVKLDASSIHGDNRILEQFEGPRNCATEIFSNLNPLNCNEANQICLVKEKYLTSNHFEKPLKTKRIGLSPKANDTNLFHLSQLRYVSDPRNFSDFKLKIRGIESIVSENIKPDGLKLEDASKILGYNKKI